MIDGLSDRLITRLKARAADPKRRSDASETLANSVGLDEMLAGMPKSSDPGVREYLEGMNTPFAGMIANLVAGDGSQAKGFLGALGALGAMLGGDSMVANLGGRNFGFGPRREPAEAPPPCREEALQAAEAALGFPLPAPLRRFYAEVADGGVGPGGGLYSLDALLAKWREMTVEPVGPRGQKWPAKLLPIQGDDWDLTSIDRESGRLVYFDAEEIDYGGWKKAFSDESDSLEAWLDKWLGGPGLHEQAMRWAEKAFSPPRPYTTEELARLKPRTDEWSRRSDIFRKTAEERRAMGLPDQDWEDRVWEGFDLSPPPGQ